MKIAKLLGLVGAVALTVGCVRAADPILDPKDAGPAYLVQGEYLGEAKLADGFVLKMGAQVAALGHDEFAATFLPGGLPGAGWDNETKVEANGKSDGTTTTFEAKGWKAVIAGESMTLTTDKGQQMTLKKTVRVSPTLGAKPPVGAVVLIGADLNPDLSAWAQGQVHKNGWFCTEGQQPSTKQGFKDCSFHLEVLLPFEPENRGQGRSNSGIYLQDRYEVQVVDSFGFKVGPGKPNGDVIGDIYSKAGAKTNAALPPLTWQTYDIDFTAPQYEDGKKVKNATATVRINGIVVHDHVEISAVTGGNGHQEKDEAAPFMLQFHHHPVFYRNFWVVEAK